MATQHAKTNLYNFAFLTVEEFYPQIFNGYKDLEASEKSGELDQAVISKMLESTCALFDAMEPLIWNMDISPSDYIGGSDDSKDSFDGIRFELMKLGDAFESAKTSNTAGNLSRDNILTIYIGVNGLLGALLNVTTDEKYADPQELASRTVHKEIGSKAAGLSQPLSPSVQAVDVFDLIDTVSTNVEKANAVLSLLGSAFAEDDYPKPNNDTVFYSLLSVKEELNGILATVQAFYEQSEKQRA